MTDPESKLQPRVCISVLNWNAAETTMQCIHSLNSLEYDNYEIVIVDNASADGSVSVLQSNLPDILLIRADTNLGYAGGNKLAHDYAVETGEFDLFWILNNDAQVQPDTLSHLVNAHLQNPDTLIGGYQFSERTLTDEPIVYLSEWVAISKRLRLYRRVKRRFALEQTLANKPPYQVCNLSGSNLLIPLHISQKHGFIDTSFFMYSEDGDYCMRLWRDGIASLLVPRSLIYHPASSSWRNRGTTNRLEPILNYYMVRGRITLFMRHFSFIMLIVELLQLTFYVITRYLYGAVRVPERGQLSRATSRYAAKGMYDALMGIDGKVYDPADFI